MSDILTQFVIIPLTLCQPTHIRLASAPQSSRYCAARVKFVHSLTVRMMPPWLVEHPWDDECRLIPAYLNLLCYE